MRTFSNSSNSHWWRRQRETGFAGWASLPTLPPRATDFLIVPEEARDETPPPAVCWDGYLRKITEG